MGRTWVLQTETKGTGATMVPLERASRRAPAPEPITVPPKPPARAQPAPKPRPPLRFRVVDLMTREELLADGGARAAIHALSRVRSVVDVNVYVWDEQGVRWRRLTFAETRTLFERSRA